MSLRQLVEGDCGGINPLMQIGGQFVRDAAYKDEGFRNYGNFDGRPVFPEEQLVNEFLGHVAEPPQTFQMNALLQEMRDIESQNFHPQIVSAPKVIDEVANNEWIKEFGEMSTAGGYGQLQSAPGPSVSFENFWKTSQPSQMIQVQPVKENVKYVNEFFDVNETMQPVFYQTPNNSHQQFMQPIQQSFDYGNQQTQDNVEHSTENWLQEFQKSKDEEAKKTQDYNDMFWQRLQDEWQKMAEESENEHPWLSEFSDLYDQQYKEYKFAEDNPLAEVDNVLDKGKEFLAKGDIPSAVLCFEAAAQKEPENAEAWELLGLSQTENEMDPFAIAALQKSLALNPNNKNVLMALAVSYTNESLQSQALKMLTKWLLCNPKYKHLVPAKFVDFDDKKMGSSVIRGPELKEIQNLFLETVKLNPLEIDPEIQEALGVLFNLSGEYNKAVDCFQAALQVNPHNAKVWNRLGASLANGTRSVEAVEAYQRALEIQPGFIRVRYNVGVCCMNLKAYKEAAEHLLMALNLQATSVSRSGLPESSISLNGIQSETIWSTFKMIISLMGRSELHDMIADKNLNGLNQALNISL